MNKNYRINPVLKFTSCSDVLQNFQYPSETDVLAMLFEIKGN